MVRRMLLVLTVAAMMAVMLAATGGNAWAFNPQPDPPGSASLGHDNEVGLPYIERSLGGPDTYGTLRGA